MKIKFSPFPVGFGPDVPVASWREGELSKREDGKLHIKCDGGYVEFRNEGLGITTEPNTSMAGCEKKGFNFLEFPGHSDRGGDIPWPTYLVAYTDME